MKSNITFRGLGFMLVAITLCSTTLHAQNQQFPGQITPSWFSHFKMPLKNRSAVQKPTDIKSRLIAVVPAYYTGSGLMKDDSLHLFWSGTRVPNVTGMDFLNRMSSGSGLLPVTQPAENPDPYFSLNCDSTCLYPWNGVYYEGAIEKDIYTLDNNGNVISTLDMDYIGSGWRNYSKSENTYNTQNELIKTISATWMNNNWENNDQFDFHYDANHNLAATTTTEWNGQWDSVRKVVSTFNTNNNTDSTLTMHWDNGAWVYDSLTTYSYNAGALPDTVILKVWDGMSMEWRNHQEYIYAYDGNGNNTSATYKEYQSGVWENTENLIYGYTGDLLTSSIYQQWNIDSAAFENVGRVLLQYNTYDQLTLMKAENWTQPGMWEFEPGDTQFTFYYEEYDDGTGIKNVADAPFFSLYPNPAKNLLHIEAGQNKIDRVSITDLSGRIVYESEAGAKAAAKSIPVNDFADGVYMLQAESAGKHSAKNFVVRH
jgi:hypothetical protein